MRPMPWANDVAQALRLLMDDTWVPSHSGLDDIFARLGIEAPRSDAQGADVNKSRRLRAAFDGVGIQGEAAVKWLIHDIVEEMRYQNVFEHPGEKRLELVEKLRLALAGAGATLASDGRIEAGYVGPKVPAGGRKTVDRLQAKLREGEQDPGSILGTSKDLLEATAKHLLHEHDPAATPGDMPAIVSQAMRVAKLSTKPSEIDSQNAKAIAGLRNQVVKTAEAVAPLRNKGGDGHGHLEPTDVTPELADYIRHLTLAAVAYLLSSVDGRPGVN